MMNGDNVERAGEAIKQWAKKTFFAPSGCSVLVLKIKDKIHLCVDLHSHVELFAREGDSLYFHIDEDMQCRVNIKNNVDGMWFTPHLAHASPGVAAMFAALGNLEEGCILPTEEGEEVQWRGAPQAPLKVWRIFQAHLDDVFTGAANPLRATRDFMWETQKQDRQIERWAHRFIPDVPSTLVFQLLGGDHGEVEEADFISEVLSGTFTTLHASFPAGVLEEPISKKFKISLMDGVNEPPEGAVLGDEMAVYKALVGHNGVADSYFLLVYPDIATPTLANSPPRPDLKRKRDDSLGGGAAPPAFQLESMRPFVDL